MTYPEMLFWLLVGHALTDFPLQGDFLAKAKNHRAPIPGTPWECALLMHALICAAPVYLITRSWALTVAEFSIHGATDIAKNEGVLGRGEGAFILDQWIHVVCKVTWVCFAAAQA